MSATGREVRREFEQADGSGGPGAGAARLVVADDDAGIRALIGAALDGYIVLEAARGDDALALVRRECPDLVVLDVQMPGLDGLTVARRLATDPATAAIPVILCSGVGPAAAAAVGRVGGVSAFLPKPFSPRELRTTVERALGAPKAGRWVGEQERPEASRGRPLVGPG